MLLYVKLRAVTAARARPHHRRTGEAPVLHGDDNMSNIRSVIVGTGSHIPPVVVPNDHFLGAEFLDSEGRRIAKSNQEILAQFELITGIRNRRYVHVVGVQSDYVSTASRDA